MSIFYLFAFAVYGTANASVCLSVRLSITLRYCVKTRKRRGMRSSPSGSPLSLVFWCQKWFIGDGPVQVKFECKQLYLPPAKTAEMYTYRLSSGTVIEPKSPIKANRKSTMEFPKSDQPRSCVTPNVPKICRFSQKSWPETIKSLLQSFIG